MRRHVPLVLAVLICAPASPAAAQRLYRFELGGSGGYNMFSDKLELASAFGAGFRLGYWFLPQYSLEADLGFASPTTNTPLKKSVSTSTFGIWALDNFRLGLTNTAFIKAGFGHTSFGQCPSVSIPGSGPCGSTGVLQAGAGARIAISPKLFMRYEVTLNRSLKGLAFSNASLQAGLSMMLGSKPLVDTDGDGVYDIYDKCPNTPLGALVDKHGCPTDQDGDGVPDGLDRCPNTPEGAAVDAAGCPMDSDGDGVLDGIDQCPNTPKGALVDATGCPQDSDGDGVPDGIDRCPLTPHGAVVDSLGCPIDSDADGVPDGLDKCPDTPPGTRVDASGCPLGPVLAPEDTLANELRWTLPGTVWELRGAVLAPDALPILDSVAVTMEASPTTVAEVDGYAQDRLIPADNTKLSKRRAEVVRDYLVSKGVAANRITATGRGSLSPIVTDTTETARTINRRVEIRVTRSP